MNRGFSREKTMVFPPEQGVKKNTHLLIKLQQQQQNRIYGTNENLNRTEMHFEVSIKYGPFLYLGDRILTTKYMQTVCVLLAELLHSQQMPDTFQKQTINNKIPTPNITTTNINQTGIKIKFEQNKQTKTKNTGTNLSKSLPCTFQLSQLACEVLLCEAHCISTFNCTIAGGGDRRMTSETHQPPKENSLQLEGKSARITNIKRSLFHLVYNHC